MASTVTSNVEKDHPNNGYTVVLSHSTCLLNKHRSAIVSRYLHRIHMLCTKIKLDICVNINYLLLVQNTLNAKTSLLMLSGKNVVPCNFQYIIYNEHLKLWVPYCYNTINFNACLIPWRKLTTHIIYHVNLLCIGSTTSTATLFNSHKDCNNSHQ